MSRRTLCLSILIPFALALVGCNKPDHEGAIKKTVSKMEELVAVMKSVQDEASSKAAAPKIRDITTDLKQYQKEMKEMAKPSAAEDQRLKTAYEGRMKQVGQDMQKEAMRIGMTPKLVTPELKSALQDMSTLQNN